MRKLYIWSLALAAFAVSGAVAASALAPSITRAEEGEVAEVKYILDPEDGAIVNDLQTISITFPENRNVYVNERMELNSIKLTNTETGDEYYCDSPVRDSRASSGAGYTLYFLTPADSEDGEASVKPITTPGAYELSITQGTFLTADEVETEESVTLENQLPVEAINATYTVQEPAPAAAYILNPEDGAIVNDLKTITVTFPDRNVQANDKMEFNAIVLTNVESGEEYYCDAPVRNPRAAEGVEYTLNFLTSVEGEEGVEESLLPITTPGEYTLSILKGAFITGTEVEDAEGNVNLENTVAVEAINAKYIVVEPAPAAAYILNPEDGAIVNDLQTITVTFPDRNVQANDKMEFNAIVLTDENGEEYYCDAPVRNARAAEGVEYTLNFLTSVESEEGIEEKLLPITAPGKYTLSIVKGAFITGTEVEDAEGNVTLENTVAVEAINATYTVVEPAPAAAYILNPEDGAIVNDLQTITVTFPDRNVQANDKMEFNAIVLTDENGEEYYCDAPVRNARAAEGVEYTLNFLTSVESEEGIEEKLLPITAPGKYTLSIVKGAFITGTEVVNEDESVTLENVVAVEAINATYTVAEPAPAAAYTLDPADGAIVDDLQTITITFDDVNVRVNDKMEFSAIVLKAENGEEYYCDAPVRDTRAAEGTVAYQLNFLTDVETEDGMESELKPITTPGSYTLTIMMGTFVTGQEVEDEEGNVTLENPVAIEAINATYTISTSGVNDVFGEDATEFNVYTINGIQVLKAADSDAVNALPAGLYIINGKKVIKR